MIVNDVRQRSPEWHSLRLGIPTASEFGKILSPTGKRSTQAETYKYRLLAEWITGAPLEDIRTEWMQRGTDLESQAVDAYEFASGNETQVVGFVTTDDGLVGCSPDRFVGADGGLEIKCPSPQVQISYLLSKTVAEEYKPQVQGCLWICERSWWDVSAYCPLLPPSIIHVERDEEYIALQREAIAEFCDGLARARAELIDRFGVTPRPVHQPEEDEDGLGISDEDLARIWAARKNGGA